MTAVDRAGLRKIRRFCPREPPRYVPVRLPRSPISRALPYLLPKPRKNHFLSLEEDTDNPYGKLPRGVRSRGSTWSFPQGGSESPCIVGRTRRGIPDLHVQPFAPHAPSPVRRKKILRWQTNPPLWETPYPSCDPARPRGVFHKGYPYLPSLTSKNLFSLC